MNTAQPYPLIYTIKLGFIVLVSAVCVSLQPYTHATPSAVSIATTPQTNQSPPSHRMPSFRIDSGAYETNPNYLEEDSWHSKQKMPRKPTLVSA